MFIFSAERIRFLQEIIIRILSKKATSRKLFFDAVGAFDLINSVHWIFESVINAHALLKFIHENIFGDIKLLYF